MVDTVIVNPAVADVGEAPTSAVSRPAIVAGGFTAAWLSVVLFTLGAALTAIEGGPRRDRLYVRR